MIRGVQNLALKTPIGDQKRSNYAKSRAKYSSELFNVTTRDAKPFPAYTESPASAKTIASPVRLPGCLPDARLAPPTPHRK